MLLQMTQGSCLQGLLLQSYPPTTPCYSNGWCGVMVAFQLVEAITSDRVVSCSEQMYDISSTMSTYIRFCCPACSLVQGSHQVLCILTFSISEHTLYHYPSYQLQHTYSTFNSFPFSILTKNIWQDTRSPQPWWKNCSLFLYFNLVKYFVNYHWKS